MRKYRSERFRFILRILCVGISWMKFKPSRALVCRCFGPGQGRLLTNQCRYPCRAQAPEP
ncbi:hypothetical protein PM082_021341 [Marasmius tenuissimus]|nr:hypothetical protein PM082_021341 [Marasmius tenuissimus]